MRPCPPYNPDLSATPWDAPVSGADCLHGAAWYSNAEQYPFLLHSPSRLTTGGTRAALPLPLGGRTEPLIRLPAQPCTLDGAFLPLGYCRFISTYLLCCRLIRQ
ncbi:hypothetical protein FKM82_002854 [Ascaphus truei]